MPLVRLDARTIALDREAVCRRLGYGESRPSAAMYSLIEQEIARAREHIAPVFTYDMYAIEGVAGFKVRLGGHLVFASKIISYVLSGCRWAAVYVATAGDGFDEEVTRLSQQGDVVNATILDIVGTEVISQVITQVRSVARGIALRRHCQATIQFPPGYCDWDIRQQEVVFQLVDAASVGVRLTESCMMVPRKSVSGVIGIGQIDITKPPPCLAACTQRPCYFKRPGWDPEKEWLL